MFDLNERLLHLAYSLKEVEVELEGSTERFYRGSLHKPGALFLEVVESGGIIYGLQPHPDFRFHSQAVRPHPHYPGWIYLANPTEEDEEALWQSIQYAYERVGELVHPPISKPMVLEAHPLQ
ncbi:MULTISPECIES: hypothetical protein [unclassified Meiothermus]|uniref:hypothetical protein n=1 Tax=unclassified Meiothermus TaxID=370471 RepID=UPI000D7B97B4|nr:MULTISPECIES: hypothetical protein [unclassified Meiothermus]PZA06664.1 hypothetical protein DNA98_11755 [Meiothermus sp. Pnk-1]RYM29183.1 hypothetical protein EWH23_16270 [Meiothermus sp. PNK-Is4]